MARIDYLLDARRFEAIEVGSSGVLDFVDSRRKICSYRSGSWRDL